MRPIFKKNVFLLKKSVFQPKTIFSLGNFAFSTQNDFLVRKWLFVPKTIFLLGKVGFWPPNHFLCWEQLVFRLKTIFSLGKSCFWVRKPGFPREYKFNLFVI